METKQSGKIVDDKTETFILVLTFPLTSSVAFYESLDSSAFYFITYLCRMVEVLDQTL